MAYSTQWKELIDKICTFEDDSSSGIWYRGQSKSSYQLHSGLFRNLYDFDNDIEEIREYEVNVYTAFSRYGGSLFNETGWNQLFIMQHHGMRTRLLDWTASFPVALYFINTCWDKKIETARLWMIDPVRLNQHIRGYSHVISLIDDNEYERIILDKARYERLRTGAVLPAHRTTRIMAQQGFFTIQGNSMIPLEEECNDPKVLSYVDITPDMTDDVERYLRQNGINDFSMFPDLNGLAKLLKNIYG